MMTNREVKEKISRLVAYAKADRKTARKFPKQDYPIIANSAIGSSHAFMLCARMLKGWDSSASRKWSMLRMRNEIVNNYVPEFA